MRPSETGTGRRLIGTVMGGRSAEPLCPADSGCPLDPAASGRGKPHRPAGGLLGQARATEERSP
jgi:hypothetical protein